MTQVTQRGSRFTWVTLAGYVYVIICLFDFLVMPALTYANHKETKKAIIEMIEADEQQYALDIIVKIDEEPWNPVTMVGGGIFHISFGAILTGVAVTGRRKELSNISKTDK